MKATCLLLLSFTLAHLAFADWKKIEFTHPKDASLFEGIERKDFERIADHLKNVLSDGTEKYREVTLVPLELKYQYQSKENQHPQGSGYEMTFYIKESVKDITNSITFDDGFKQDFVMERTEVMIFFNPYSGVYSCFETPRMYGKN